MTHQTRADHLVQRSRVGATSILSVLITSAIGGFCAWLAGWLASTWIWDREQAPVTAKWCLVCYLVSSFLSSATSLRLVRTHGGSADRVSSVISQNLGFGALSFPLAYAGGYAGRLVGALIGMLTAPFGPNWLDVAVSMSGQGFFYGVVLGVALPWLILLNTR